MRLAPETASLKEEGLRLDIYKVLRRLPHRYPLLLVDRVVRLEKGKRIEALKNVTINDAIFRGCRSRCPVMPSVLILEAMAQAAALLAFETVGASSEDTAMYYFGSIHAARFKRPVVPGDQLRLDVTFVRSRARVSKFMARAHVGGDLAAQAEFLGASVGIA